MKLINQADSLIPRVLFRFNLFDTQWLAGNKFVTERRSFKKIESNLGMAS